MSEQDLFEFRCQCCPHSGVLATLEASVGVERQVTAIAFLLQRGVNERNQTMGSIIVGKIGPETRLPQSEARELSSSTTVVGSLERAVECLLGAQARCLEVAAESENRSAAYAQAVADRYEAIRLLRDTPASSRVELETKRDILCELDRWIGRDDHACCDFAFHLVQEAIHLMNAGQADDEVEDSRVGYGHWISPGRWLMGAAANVPAFIVDRFGLG